MKKLIVFTDLDGTLLNHDDYDFSAALPAIDLLRQRDVPIIFTSSKTLPELQEIADKTNICAPVIYETGCGIAWPEGYFPHLDTEQHSMCIPYSTVIDTLSELRTRHQFKFTGFNDLTMEEISSLTGLDVKQAQSAKSRQYGEPILWQDSTQALDHFNRLIHAAALRSIQGGRFIHVMSPTDKASAISWLMEQYRIMNPQTEWQTVGLGDSPNDSQLLECVDTAYLVRNLHLQQEQAQLMRLPGLKQTIQSGAAGWNEAISGLLQGDH